MNGIRTDEMVSVIAGVGMFGLVLLIVDGDI